MEIVDEETKNKILSKVAKHLNIFTITTSTNRHMKSFGTNITIEESSNRTFLKFDFIRKQMLWSNKEIAIERGGILRLTD
jgi:hypothetical protein